MIRRAIDKARTSRRSDSGFTLIELLIVIVILGVLAAIVVFSVRGITDTGEEAACEANYKTTVTALEAYYANDDNGVYPATTAALVPSFLTEDPSASGDPQVDVTYTGGGATYTLAKGTSCD
ncbi:type II secretion system protein [Nocardioides jensenii]|uniref:type II secretion system protein n=1 Tax=Nocardioides jensenii TaxID=1843 RepID=UPI00082E2E26|nr:prepilin-type N-terminal cleavage/methylation domain-containing protein [Nocardioides jensenii]